MSKRLLITAGPTHEPIDAVRYIANRSSGRLGIALAEAGIAAGWEVTLLLGPTPLAPPAPGPAKRPLAAAPLQPAAGLHVMRYESTADLEALLREYFPRCDVLLMAAAVADYRPAAVSAGKLPRRGERLEFVLEPTPDLAAACARAKRPGQRVIGFALEERDVLAARAADKLARKGLDAIVANPLETMGAERIDGVLFTACGERLTPPGCGPWDKAEFARWLMGWLAAPE